MNIEIPHEVLQAFTSCLPRLPSHSAGKITIKNIGHGLINNSFVVDFELKHRFFLQKINPHVFSNPGHVQENYILFWQYAEKENTGLKLPSPLYWSPDNSLFKDDAGNFWRAFEWIQDSKTANIASDPQQAKSVAFAFARFTAAFKNINLSTIHEIIPGFHDLSLRYSQFEESLRTDYYERKAKAAALIHQLQERKRYRDFFDAICKPAACSKKLMHHDAKISNVLFHSKTNEVICPVDYDTAMPGYFFSDLGDMIRSMAGSLDENAVSGEIHIREDYYNAIISGYTDGMGDYLSNTEKKYIHSAGILITYMQALRFITDYLNGDTYYKVSYKEQNFDRAGNQLRLLFSLEKFLKESFSFSI